MLQAPITVFKVFSQCSFISHKLRFFEDFYLVLSPFAIRAKVSFSIFRTRS